MAKKEKPSVEAALAYFKEVMERGSFTEFLHTNGIMISTNNSGISILIVVDKTLWDVLSDDEGFKEHLKEINILDPEQKQLHDKLIHIIDGNSDEWISIDPQAMYDGKIVYISLSGFNYELSINKGLIPVKMKKAEYNNFNYRVLTSPHLVLALNKTFIGPVEDTNFSMIRAFQII